MSRLLSAWIGGIAASLRTYLPPSSPAPQQPEDQCPLTPSYADVCVVRAMLRSLKLPTELVLEILEYAEYWPSLRLRMEHSCEVTGGALPVAGKIGFEFDALPDEIVRSFGEGRVKVKAVEWMITSRDQGWTSEGTQGTYTTSSWIETSIIRPMSPNSIPDLNFSNHPRLHSIRDSYFMHRIISDDNIQWGAVERPASAEHYPQGEDDKYAWYIQGNQVASRTALTHKVVWSVHEDRCEGNEGSGSGEGFLEALRPGDKVLVWARAKWAGWSCKISGLEVTVRYGV